jgi:hypothetical protein
MAPLVSEQGCPCPTNFVKMNRIFTREKYGKIRMEYPGSNLETQVTLATAQRALNCVYKIHELICDCIPAEQIGGLDRRDYCDKLAVNTVTRNSYPKAPAPLKAVRESRRAGAFPTLGGI